MGQAMIVCWPITTAVKHAVRHHVIPHVVRPLRHIRRAIAARPPVKTVTKWACVVVSAGGAVGGGAMYGPGFFAPPPSAVAAPFPSGGDAPSTGAGMGGLVFGPGGFERIPDTMESERLARIDVLSPTFSPSPPSIVPTPPVPIIEGTTETITVGEKNVSPVPIIEGTTETVPVPEPGSILLFATGIAGLFVLRRWRRI